MLNVPILSHRLAHLRHLVSLYTVPIEASPHRAGICVLTVTPPSKRLDRFTYACMLNVAHDMVSATCWSAWVYLQNFTLDFASPVDFHTGTHQEATRNRDRLTPYIHCACCRCTVRVAVSIGQAAGAVTVPEIKQHAPGSSSVCCAGCL